MSLDETGVSVWLVKRPPLAMLVTGAITDGLADALPEEPRAAFHALTAALAGWWPRRKRDPEDIYAVEYAACYDAVETLPSPKAGDAVLAAATLQLAALLRSAPRGLPAGDHYNLSEEDFVKLLRDYAKVSRLPLAQLEARLKFLHERMKRPWDELQATTARMQWARGARWGKLEKRVKQLAALADLGASCSWEEVAGQAVLRLELEGTKRITRLEDEELSELRRVAPQIGAPPA